MTTLPAITRLFLCSVFIAFSVKFPLPVSAQSKPADASAKESGSLTRVPDTAGYYFASMNHEALVDRIFNSNAWKAIKSTDVARGMKKAYRRGKSRGYEEYNSDNPFAQYLAGYGESVGSVPFQSFWQIAKEVVKNELFVYVDNDAVVLAKAIRQLQTDFFKAIPADNFENEFEKQEFRDALLESVRANFLNLQCPTVIVGARLDDPDGFRGILELARSAAEQGIALVPDEMKMVKRWWNVTDEKEQYLLAFDIQLADLPMQDFLDEIDDPDLSDLVVDVVSDKKASVVLGVVDDLLVLGMASDKQKLIGFGDAPKLIDMPMMKRLKTSVTEGETITAVGYISPEFCRLTYSLEDALEAQQFLIKTVVGTFDELNEEEKQQLVSDIRSGALEFARELKTLFPTPSALYGYATLHSDGLHGFSLTKLSSQTEEKNSPLELAQHAGPETVAFLATRPAMLGPRYAFVAKWTAKIFNNLPAAATDKAIDAILYQLEEQRDRIMEDEKAELPEQPTWEDAKEILTFSMDRVRSIALKFDRVTREKLIPEMTGKEMGFFVEMQSGPNSWCDDMPASEQPLAIPLPALVMGIANSDNVIEAGTEYLNIADEALEFVKELTVGFDVDDEKLSKLKIVQPERIDDGDEVSFRWDFLAKIGQFDPSLRTGTRLSNDWMVMNFNDQQAHNLMKRRGSDHLFGPAFVDEPSTLVMFFDNRVATRHGRQWLEYGLQQAKLNGVNPLDLTQYEAERDTLQFTEPEMRQWLDRVWDFGTCFQGISGRSYKTEEGVAGEWLLKFEDVPAQQE